MKCIEEEIPFHIPDNWEWSRITGLCTKITDGTHHSPDNYPTGDYMYVTAKNIKESGVILDDITYVTKAVHDEIYSRCNPENGDILYIKDGATSGIATINDIEEEFSLLSSVALLKPSHTTNNWFLCYVMQSPYFYATTRGDMKGVGITRITLTMINSRLIPVAPLDEQKRIVDCLQHTLPELNELDDNKQEILDLIDSTKSKILNMAIRGQLVPQDLDDEPASVLLERIREEKENLIKQGKLKRDKKESIIYKGDDNSYYELTGKKQELIDDILPFEIPSTWTWCRLGSICTEILYGLSNSAEIQGTHRLLRITDIQNGKVDWDTVPYTTTEDADKYLLKENDIVFARTGATVGKSFLIKDIPVESVYASYLIRIRLLPGINAEYIYDFFNSPFYWRQITDKAVGVGQPNCNGTLLQELIIPLPPLSEQVCIHKKVLQYNNEISKIGANLE